MLQRRRWLGGTALLLAALAVAGCGGDDDTGRTPGAGDASPSATARATVEATATTPQTPRASQPAATPTAAPSPATATPSASPTPPAAPSETPPPPTPAPTRAPTQAPPPVSLTVHARGVAFDQATLRFRSGGLVTVEFENEDAGIPHNLTFSFPGSYPTCTGPCSTTTTFTAPAPGTHSFFCTIHEQMFGQVVVDP